MKLFHFLFYFPGEIATRVFRACTELGIESVGIWSEEDKHQSHRIKCDKSFPLSPVKGGGPIAPYLNIDEIVEIAVVSGGIQCLFLKGNIWENVK